MTNNGNLTDISLADARWAQDLFQGIPVVLKQSSTISQAIEAFCQQQLDCVLVVDETVLTSHMKLIGRISIKDILRTILPCLLKKDFSLLNDILNTPIENIILKHPKTVTPWSNISGVLAVMLGDFTQVVGVEQDGKLLGQVTCNNILRAITQINHVPSVHSQLHPNQHKVKDSVASHVICLSDNDDISRAICLFIATAARHIPILDGQAGLIGIFSQQDILEHLLQITDPIEMTVFQNRASIINQPVTALIQKELPVLSFNADIKQAALEMIRHNVTCLAITDIQKKFYGLLSCSELIKWTGDRLLLNNS